MGMLAPRCWSSRNQGLQGLLFFASTSLILCFASGISFPPPPRAYDSRPTSDPYCQAGVIPFCPTGFPPNVMPKMQPNDTLIVYAMKAPVWEFKFGSLLKKFNIMHDAIGFHHVQLGLNITMEWYELFQLFNCTFPHEPEKGKLLWCNQGATCGYMGIDAKHWRENGTLVKVSEISGDIFNKFANWTETDNNTYPYYESWTVLEPNSSQVWFNPFDCASWVLRAFDKMHEFGAQFNQSVHLNYTKVNLFSSKPVYLGEAKNVVRNPFVMKELTEFYSHFQHYNSYAEMLENVLLYIAEILTHIESSFYLYYNDQYWKLPLKSPYISLTYDEVPLPGN